MFPVQKNVSQNNGIDLSAIPAHGVIAASATILFFVSLCIFMGSAVPLATKMPGAFVAIEIGVGGIGCAVIMGMASAILYIIFDDKEKNPTNVLSATKEPQIVQEKNQNNGNSTDSSDEISFVELDSDSDKIFYELV